MTGGASKTRQTAKNFTNNYFATCCENGSSSAQMPSLSLFFLSLLLLSPLFVFTQASADDDELLLKSRVPCKNHNDCSFLGGSSYECFNGEFCIRSTIAGCLRDKNNGGAPSRVCNSNDSQEIVQMGLCRPPRNEEMEIRIYAFDWDSSMFQTWILQILLSELLDVPVSVESGTAHIDFSFYSQDEIGSKGRVFYNSFSSIDRALQFAHVYGDCRQAQKEILAKYEPCAHFAPEVRHPIRNSFSLDTLSGGVFATNNENDETSLQLGDVGLITEPLEPAGGFGEQGLYIPKFTAERDPSLTIYFGLSGEENRKKLADTFLRPTRWGDYCSQVSPTQCAEGDDAATRAPADKTEADRFFVPGVYTGHFRKTAKNDCDKNPLTCTGHVADYSCGLKTPVENQIFELDLILEGDGYMNRFGYLLPELEEIWHAANYTKSDVLLYWMKPTLLSQEYAGTDAEFTKVSFPPPSQACIDARRDSKQEKCLQIKPESFGIPEAVCDDPPFQLQKATSTSLHKLLVDGVPEDIRSPSYAVLKAYILPEMELSKFLADLKVNDDPRHAVCDWVTNNMDMLEKFIPPTYPRVLEDMDQTILLYTSLSLGTTSALLVIWTARKVYVNRKNTIIRFAQFEFLALMLMGSLLTAIGAIIDGFPRRDGICVAEIWFVYLGYTLALVPQIVKVAAINRLMSAARRYERLKLNLKNLYGAVTVVSLLVAIYLAIWTVLDSPLTRTHYTLTDSMTASGETIVFASYSCGSDMAFWKFIAFAWNGLLLLSAVVLAVQSRNVVREFNESQTLGILIYTNFVFFMFRGLTYYLERVVDPSIILRYRSIIYSLDVIANLVVYFWPKLYLCTRKKKGNLNRHESSSNERGVSMGGFSFDSNLGSTFFTMPKPSSPMFTSLPNNRFIRLLTNVSHITFHPNEDDSVSFPIRKDESHGKPWESAKVDEETSDADLSGDLDSKSDNDDSYVQKLEMTILGLETELTDLRKRIRDGKLHSLSSVGADPPSPVSSSPELDKEDSLKRSTSSWIRDVVSSQRIRDGDHERALNNSDKIPGPMPSSSSSEKVSISDQESQAVSVSETESFKSMPPLTSYYSGSESALDSEVSVSETESFASMPPLTSYYSGSESALDSEVSVSETESCASPITQSPKPTVAQVMPSVPSIHLISESGGIEGPLRRQRGTQPAVTAPRIPLRRPSLPSESQESLLSEVSIFSISEQEEHC